jgi:hypothetical protein
MERQEFAAVMPFISADLANMIAEKEGLSEVEAVSRLYASELYAQLEQEETKLWQYSTPMLYVLYKQGKADGTIQFPDV